MHIFFDIVIFFLILFFAYWMYVIIHSFFYDRKNNVKTKIIRIIFLIIIFIGFSLIFLGSFILPKIISLKEVNIDFEKTPTKENIKIAFISDPHVGRYKKADFMQKVVNKIDSLKPDIVVMTGDFILQRAEYAIYLEPLSQLRSKYPVYAVFGNHESYQGFYLDPKTKDQTKYLRKLFNKWNIQLLENENATIEINNQKISILGIKEIWTGQASITDSLGNTADSKIKILLAHNPDAILMSGSEQIDLVLSGHTHAGQIRLPWLGPVPPVGTELGRNYAYGLFKKDDTLLYVTSGIGESGPRARFFSLPEIVLFNINL